MSDNSVDALVADSHNCGIDDGRPTRNTGKVDYRVRCYKAARRTITRPIERMKKLWKEEKYRRFQRRRRRRSESRRKHKPGTLRTRERKDHKPDYTLSGPESVFLG